DAACEVRCLGGGHLAGTSPGLPELLDPGQEPGRFAGTPEGPVPRHHLPETDMTDLRHATGAEVRRRAREGSLSGPPPGLALGFVQANLVVVPRDLAFDFLLFCQRNPKPCPLLDVTEAGSPEPRLVAPDADLRTDVPRYRVWRHGELVDEPADLHGWWRD